MPNRKLPPEILAHLGPCREPETPAEKVVEQLGLAKYTCDADLTDFDPLVRVMQLVAEEVVGLGLPLDQPAGRTAWLGSMEAIQRGEASLDHNRLLPCRSCDQAFEPAIDATLLEMFLAWDRSGRFEDLIAIHRCPACGGKLSAKRTKTYKGDMHTPGPGSVEDDQEWAGRLLNQGEW